MNSIQQFINWGLWINKNEFEILSKNKQVTKENKKIASTWSSKVSERILYIVCGCTPINTHRQWLPSGKGREEWDQGGIHRSLRFTHDVLFLKLAGEIMGLCCFPHVWYAWNVSEAVKWQRHPGYLFENSCMCSVQQLNRTGGRGALSPQLPTSTPQPKQLLLFLPQFGSIGKSSCPSSPTAIYTCPPPPSKPTAKSMLSGPSLGALLSGSLGPAPEGFVKSSDLPPPWETPST